MTGLELAIVGYIVAGLAMAANLLDLIVFSPPHRIEPHERRRELVEQGRRAQEAHPMAWALAVGVFMLMTVLLWPIPFVNGIRRRLAGRPR